MIKEMCQFSNLSNSSNTVKLQGGICVRDGPVNPQRALMTTKKVVEDYNIVVDGDHGTNGRPRFREEIKMPP